MVLQVYPRGDGDVVKSGVTADGEVAVWNGANTYEIKSGGYVPGRSVWEIKSSGFTAVAGHYYLIDTSGGSVTVTMPASATAGDAITFSDGEFTWNTDPVTLDRNGLKIGGASSDYTANVIGSTITAIYLSAGYGWSVK